ncbi:MAG: sulfite exporter TauE/SafE family protein [Gammaproteobacteria bacterium]
MILVFEYLCIGALAGLLAGLLGVGGAILVVPALLWIFSTQVHFPADQIMHFVVGTSLAATIATTLFSLRAQYRKGFVVWSLVVKLLPGIIIGVILGTILARLLDTHILRILFGVFMILVAVQTFFKLRESVKPPGLPSLMNRGIATTTIGVFSGLLGISGGALTIPYLIYFKLPIRQAMGASTACGVMIALVGTISFILSGWSEGQAIPWCSGFVYWPAALLIAAASPWFATLGASLSHRLPVNALRKIFAGFLCLVGLNMLL